MSWRDPLSFIRSKFLRDTATLQLGGALNQLSQVFSSVALALILSAEGQGLFFLAVTLQALFYNLVSVGVVQATVTQVAAASVRDARDKVAAWLAFLVKSYGIFSLGMVATGWWILPRVAQAWYGAKLGSEQAQQLGQWAFWMTLWPLLDTPRAVAQVAFQGTRRMLALAQMENAVELLRMFLVVTGALISRSPAGAVVGEVASRLLGSLLASDLYRAARADGGAGLPALREVFARVPEIPFRRGLALGLRVGVVRNATSLVLSILPPLILGAQVGTASVAYFKVASKLVGLPSMLLQAVSRTVLPALAELRGLGNLERFRRTYWRATAISAAALALLLLLLLPLVRPVVGLFYPRDYPEPVYFFTCILGLATLCSAFGVGSEAFYILADRLRVSLILTVVGALITIPLNLWMIQRWPAVGVAWGLVVYQAWSFVHLGYIAWFFRRNADAWRAATPREST